MDLNYTADEQRFRDELRSWMAANVPQDWTGRKAAGHSMEEHFAYLRAWQKRVYDGGWAGISWPRQYGGRGASVIEQVIFTEEMARASAPPLANTLGLSLIGPTIINHGAAAQKERFLAGILSADEIWCQGFSEPNAGSDLASLLTEARPDGSDAGGDFIVNGQKVWTSYGWAADWCELVVRTDPAVPKHKGLTVLLVDMKTPGIQVRGLRQMSGESEFSEIFFRDVSVPAENLCGKMNDGWNVAISTL